MADLDKGVIAEVDSPWALRSARFVAEFIGSASVNILSATVKANSLTVATTHEPTLLKTGIHVSDIREVRPLLRKD